MKGKEHIKGKGKVLQWESDRISFGLRVAFALDYDFSNKCVTNYILIVNSLGEFQIENINCLFKFVFPMNAELYSFFLSISGVFKNASHYIMIQNEVETYQK